MRNQKVTQMALIRLLASFERIFHARNINHQMSSESVWAIDAVSITTRV